MSEFQASSMAHFDDTGEPTDTEAKRNTLNDLLKAADRAFEHVIRCQSLECVASE